MASGSLLRRASSPKYPHGPKYRGRRGCCDLSIYLSVLGPSEERAPVARMYSVDVPPLDLRTDGQFEQEKVRRLIVPSFPVAVDWGASSQVAEREHSPYPATSTTYTFDTKYKYPNKHTLMRPSIFLRRRRGSTKLSSCSFGNIGLKTRLETGSSNEHTADLKHQLNQQLPASTSSNP
ncbi:hypothetical protein BDP55DRAFT_629050 [Colletotrichum godetiae]|uniref:Uncharacterized protein n=1 Tax=Colletotrichum godetiae TaxID=1209918 RepID=A0AAJ0ARI8_9PEZI|nr:uncharacterized protein BDP55DRAFT_629050 [Colletotrichum godetiae]KAK1689058.1 hypothetical protein BDP55DRAFT_629050 [Colletotrichum godetiae]